MSTQEYFPPPFDDTQPDLTVPAYNAPYPPMGIPAPPPPPGAYRPRTSRSRGPVVALTVIALLAVGIVGGALYLSKHAFLLPGASADALSAAKGYCIAVQGANYSQAYSYFGAALQTQVPMQVYPQLARDVDAQLGRVTACTTGGATTNGADATVAATLKRQQVDPQQLTWHLTDASGAWRFAQSPEPSLPARATAANYCANLQGARYATIYATFPAALQQQLVSLADYTAVTKDIDAALGKATGCATTGADIAADGSAVAHLTVTRKQAETDDVSVAVPTTGLAPLAGPPDASLLPRTVALLFCNDLKAKDYNGAFQFFTPAAQQAVGSPDSLKQNIESKEILTGPITDCHSQTFALNADKQSGTLNGQLTTKALFGPLNFPTSLLMIEVASGQWKIDDATIAGVGL
jgi:hypothetical protein